MWLFDIRLCKAKSYFQIFMRFFLICICITLSPWGYSSSLSRSVSIPAVESSEISAVESFEVSAVEGSGIPLTDSPVEETTLPVDLPDKARKSVWKIKRPLSYNSGTAFSIGPNLFVTNFHVMLELLRNNNPIKNIILRQENSSSQLTIKRIIKASALYDLVLFETEENIEGYLDIAESVAQPDEELFMFVYSKEGFRKIEKTGKLIDDNYRYVFPVNHSYLGGASGSPVLNQQGQVVGISFYANSNILSAMKSNYLEDLITGDIGLNCSDFISSAKCMKEAVRSVKILAEQDSVLAQYRLAFMLYKGRGVERDPDLAFSLAQESALQGHVLAQFLLAKMYDEGVGTERNFNMILIWLEKLVSQGYADAQYILAMIYFEGEEVEKDFHLAFSLMQESASQNYAPAQYILATMYLESEDTIRGIALASEWMRRAAFQGYIPAQESLMVMYVNDKLIGQDFKLIFDLAQELAYQGHVIAQYAVAIMCYKGEGTVQDYNLATAWMQLSALMGYAPAQKFLESLFDGNSEQLDVD